MVWAPGQSGNPGGRPSGLSEIREAARKHTKASLDTLVAALGAASEAVRVSAANALLDRAWGKPEQAITGADGAPLIPAFDPGNLSDADLAVFIRLIRLARGTAGSGGCGSEGGGGAGAPGEGLATDSKTKPTGTG